MEQFKLPAYCTVHCVFFYNQNKHQDIKIKNLATFLKFNLAYDFNRSGQCTSATSASSGTLFHSHHEAKSTPTIVTQFEAD